MEPEGNESRSARKRQKVDETATGSSSARKDWYGGPHNAASDSSKHTGFARRDSYNKDEISSAGAFGYGADPSYDRNRGSYDREYPNYAADTANWKQRGSTWYDDYPSSGAAYGTSASWSGDARYREYPPHDADPYAAAPSSGFYRSNSGRLDGYGYDGYYRSSSVERGDAYLNERSAAVPSSSGNAYYGSTDAYASSRYDYPQGGFENSRYEAQPYSAEGQGAGRYGKAGRFGFSSAYRAGNGEANTGAGGRYANTFKARQYSFGNKKVNKNKTNTTTGAAGGRRSAAVSDGEAQQEQKEPEKPKIIDDVKVKDYLALRSTLLDYHLTMALLKLNLKPDPDMRKTLLDQKMAEAGIYVAPEVSKEPVPVVPVPAAAMPAPEQLSRVNSVEVKQKPIPGASLSRAESAGPAVLKRDVSGVKRQNTWNNAALSAKDADTMSVSSAISGKEETKSDYGSNKQPFPNRGARDTFPAQADIVAQPVPDSYDSAWKAPQRSRDTSSAYPADTMPAPAAGLQRDARQPSRDRSAHRSRSRSHAPPVAAAYSRDTSAVYAGHDSRDRTAARGHSREGRDAYDYPAGGYYDYPAASAYPAADRYPDDRYGYDAYAYGGYDDRGYGAYPAYDRYDQYASGRADSRDRADYGYDARGVYGAAPATAAAGRYEDRRDSAASGRGAGGGGGRGAGGRGNARSESLVRQGSAGSVASHRSRSRSPPPASVADAGGRPPRGAPGADASGPKIEREVSRDASQGVPANSISRANSNSRGNLNQNATASQPQAAFTPVPAVAAAPVAPAAPRAATPSQEREPGESSPISTPEAPPSKRPHREVIIAKPQNQQQNQAQNQQGFNKGYGGGGAQGFKGKQGQFHGQQGGGSVYGPNQGHQQGHYGNNQGNQGQGQQGGHQFNKQHNNKFQKNGAAGQGQGQQNHQGGAGPGPKPSPGKKQQQAPAAAVVTEVAPLKTPR